MSVKYQKLLSPIKVGNIVFKNRLLAARSSPMFIQGEEMYPTEALITHYANKAKNGAALVTCGGVGMPHFIPERDAASFSAKSILPGTFDIESLNCQRYLAQLTDAIHFYGGIASMQIGGYVPLRYDVSKGIPSLAAIPGTSPRVGEEIPPELLDEVAEDFARQAAIMQAAGFDMVYLHMAYRLTILGRFLSYLTNKRHDQYGGSLENKARFPLMVADRIKRRCGQDFLIEACISGNEPPGGYDLKDAINYARIFAGHIDLLQIRGPEIDPTHPTGFTPERTPFLNMAEAVKKSDAKIAVVTVGGYLDLDISEEVIASGKADFIAMARGWISNPEYGHLAYQGRNENVVPCIRCNVCFRGIPASVCSVNPVWGLEHKIERMISPPGGKKKVAIAGGGPAGMKAALVAVERGHDVTLYEKSDDLGGLLKTTEGVSFKWPQRDYKRFLVRQILKTKVRVLLNKEATPEIIRNEGYDVVLVAIGAEPIVPNLPGVDGKNVVFATAVFGNEAVLAKSVVIIGGGEVGVETGMHLAEMGHQVTVLEMGNIIAPNAPKVHFYAQMKTAWGKLDNLKFIIGGRCNLIAMDKLTYVDSSGAKQVIRAGNAVIAVGMKPKHDLALKFVGSADQVFMIGDCVAVGNIQRATRSAFSTASMF